MIEATVRHELGVTMNVYRRKHWTDIVAASPYSDGVGVFDHTVFSERDAQRELRNALRRHARYVHRQLVDSFPPGSKMRTMLFHKNITATVERVDRDGYILISHGRSCLFYKPAEELEPIESESE